MNTFSVLLSLHMTSAASKWNSIMMSTEQARRYAQAQTWNPSSSIFILKKQNKNQTSFVFTQIAVFKKKNPTISYILFF